MADMGEGKSFPIIFTLTDLTGKKAQTGRTTVMWGTEVPRRYIYLGVAGFFPGVMLMAITAPFLGIYSFGAFALVIVSLIVAVEWRSRTGLKQRLYKTVYDSVTAIENEFILCGQRIPVAAYSPGIIYRSTVITDVGNRELSRASSMPGLGSGATGEVHDIFSDLVGDEDSQQESHHSAELPHSRAPKSVKARKSKGRGPNSPSADEMELTAAAGHLGTSESHSPGFDDLELDAPLPQPSPADEPTEAASTSKKAKKSRLTTTTESTTPAPADPTTPADAAEIGHVDDALEGFL